MFDVKRYNSLLNKIEKLAYILRVKALNDEIDEVTINELVSKLNRMGDRVGRLESVNHDSSN